VAGIAWLMAAAVLRAEPPPVPFADPFFDWGFMASRLEDAAGDERFRAVGPFFEHATGPQGQELLAVLRPIWSRALYPSQDRTRWDFLWPLSQGKTFGEQKSWRVLTAYFHDQDRHDLGSLYRFWAIPLWFQGRDKTGGTYAALFPVGGEIRDFLWMDRLSFVLWPIWMNSQVNDVVTTAVLWPIFSRTRTPDGHVDRIRVFPFYARSTASGQYEKTSVLWPLWTHAHYTHPRAEGTAWVFFPLMGRVNLNTQKGWMFLPPLFQHIKGEQMTRTFFPWPFFIRETGYRDKLYLWPFYGRRQDGELRRRFWLWPVVINEENAWGHSHLSRWSVVPFFINITQTQAPAETGGGEAAAPVVLAKRTKLWPLYSRNYDTREKAYRFRFLDLWPGPNPPPVERSWAPLWTLVDYRAQNENSDLDVLWGLYRQARRADDEQTFSLFPLWRHDRAGNNAARRWSVLKGLLAYDRSATNRQVRFLWLGRINLGPASAAAGAGDAPLDAMDP
jgi:hypothetical protein